MHKEYISSEEKYQEYWDRLDNQLLMNSKIRLAKMYEEKAEKYSKEAEKYSKEAEKYSKKADEYSQKVESLSHETEKLSAENVKLHEEKAMIYNEKEQAVQQLHEEKINYNQNIKSMINQAIHFRFQEDISQWLDRLNDEQLEIVQRNLYTVNSVKELQKLI